MNEKDFVVRVRNIIANKYNIDPNEVYVVWMCKTLQIITEIKTNFISIHMY